MKTLTLTPEATVYAVAGVALLATSCTFLAGYLHGRLAPSRVDLFLPVYVLVMALAAGCGLAVARVPTLVPETAAAALLALPVGLATGVVAVWADTKVRRLGRSLLRRRGAPPIFGIAGRPVRSPRLGAALPVASVRPDLAGPARARINRHAVALLLALAAVLEEVLFRGILLTLALKVPWGAAAAACVAGTVAAFALSHITLGWTAVAAKIPLALLAVATTMAMGSIAAAVVAHITFNLWTWAAVQPPSRRLEARPDVGDVDDGAVGDVGVVTEGPR